MGEKAAAGGLRELVGQLTPAAGRQVGPPSSSPPMHWPTGYRQKTASNEQSYLPA